MTSQEVLKEMQQSKYHRIEWATEDQMSKVDSVLKSVARDWSAEGSDERRVVYDRMLMALEKYLPLDRREEMNTDAGPPRISVPGSGACKGLLGYFFFMFAFKSKTTLSDLIQRKDWDGWHGKSIPKAILFKAMTSLFPCY